MFSPLVIQTNVTQNKRNDELRMEFFYCRTNFQESKPLTKNLGDLEETKKPLLENEPIRDTKSVAITAILVTFGLVLLGCIGYLSYIGHKKCHGTTITSKESHDVMIVKDEDLNERLTDSGKDN